MYIIVETWYKTRVQYAQNHRDLPFAVLFVFVVVVLFELLLLLLLFIEAVL